MRIYTHISFAFSLLVVDVFWIQDFNELEKLFILPGLIFISYFSLLPNKLESLYARLTNNSHSTVRWRHPLTHSPLTGFVLHSVLFIIDTLQIVQNFDSLILWYCLVAYFSHLFLDAFTYEGLPLWRDSTLFQQDKMKYYCCIEAKREITRITFSSLLEWGGIKSYKPVWDRGDEIINTRITIWSLAFSLALIGITSVELLLSSSIIQEALLKGGT